MKLIIFIILNMYTQKVLSQNLCSHKTCNECIRDSNKCVWCAMEVFSEDRCAPESSLTSDWCLNNTINPPSRLNFAENREFNSERNNVVQLKPQKADINIRAGSSVNFEFSFKGAKDYPVDLYFLFDASKTMEEIKKETSDQSENIYRKMQSMTNDVYLGMGSFVDKNALPYTQVLNDTLVYSFKNRLKLINNVQLFKKTVAELPFGENFDEQEGTLDALAQVLTCEPEIGWRKQSRKIVILLTDSPYHAAGDGRLAGIVKPYDGKCYMENGDYKKKELEMDYPSVGIIRKLTRDNEITVIFVVSDETLPVYNTLSEYVKGSKVASYKDGNVADIVKNIYQVITRKTKIKVNMKPEHAKFLRVTFNPNCYNSDSSQKCQVKQNTLKKFTGTIKLLKYFPDNIKVDVLIEGIKEQLTLNINVIKDCDCISEFKSTLCNQGGTRRCGICECDSGRYGLKCECSATKIGENYDNSSCIAPNSSSICNNNPRLCKCGSCSCSEGLEGKYCECGPKSCKKKCRDNEYCNCGTCMCNKGWTGESCSCTESKKECTEDGIECNDRGQCVCGACKCDEIPKWDARRRQNEKCMIIPDSDQSASHSRQCLILENCALCYLNEDSCPQCVKNINGTMVNILNSENLKEFPNECQLRARVGCYTKFLYRYNDGTLYNIELLVQKELDCAESYIVTGVSCAAAAIIIGLITLAVWKYLVHKHDREELERFEKMHQELKSSDFANPLYEPAVKEFNNPSFRKSSLAED